MSNNDDYLARYDQLAMTLEGGILDVRLHSGNDSFRWGASSGRELGAAFRDIASDQRLRVVILGGTGRDFCSEFEQRNGSGPGAHDRTPAHWDEVLHEGAELFDAMLAIRVPMIAVVNGPARIHAELPVLCDIVLACESAVFQDKAHVWSGIVPGDGVHVVWPALIGPNRARYFLLTAQELTAVQALELGIVSEIHPIRTIHARARELADYLAARPPLTLRYTRSVLNLDIRRRMTETLGIGLALEGLSAVELQGYRMNSSQDPS